MKYLKNCLWKHGLILVWCLTAIAGWAPAQTNVICCALRLEASPSPADEGNPVTITATLFKENLGPVQGVQLAYLIPPDTTYLSTRSPGGGAVLQGDRVLVPVGQVPFQQPVPIDFEVVPEREGNTTHVFELLVPGLELRTFVLELPVRRRLDFGDAPDPTYPTLLASNGARSRIVKGWHLGPLIDREPDGQPAPDALGDDVAGSAPDDEDGVQFLSPLVTGMPASVQVISATDGFVDAWIDFAANGTWADAGDQILLAAPVVRGTNVFSFSVPAGLAPTPTYARFRLSRAGSVSYDGLTLFGEVEDYRLRIRQPGQVLVQVVPSENPPVAGIPMNLSVEMINPGGETVPNLVINLSLGWQPAVGTVVSSQGSCQITGQDVTCHLGSLEPQKAAMVQITVTPLDQDLILEGTVSDGEGMDFTRFNYELLHEVFGYDYGDAPDPSFPTLLASGGARHFGGPLRFGVRKDYEINGQPHWLARGDDLAGGPDDEDGIMMLGPIVAGKGSKVQIVASGPGLVDAWIDFEGDGNWVNPGDQIFASQPVVAGTNVLNFPTPLWAKNGRHFARFRISSAGGLNFAGTAPDGEVEDYRLRVMRRKFRPDITLDKFNREHELNWEGPDSVLQHADEIGGPWLPVRGATSPYRIPSDQARKFYRLWEPEPGLNLPGMLQKAQLVFQGTVVDIQYRNSNVDEDNPVSIPCTFVTFAITDILMGRYPEGHITLQFAGGLAADGSIMIVSGSTLFDVGEQVILFARSNGKVAVPMVRGSLGRFRIQDGKVYTEGGQHLLWNDEASVEVGSNADLEEVRVNDVGGQLIQRLRGVAEPGLSDNDDQATATVFQSSQPITVDLFKNAVRDLVGTVYATEELGALPQMANVSTTEPFFVPQPKSVAPNRFKLVDPLIPDEVGDAEEQQLYEANGNNPVLP